MSLEVIKPKIGELLKIDPSITKTDIEGYRAVEDWSKGPSARNPWISEYESWKKVSEAIKKFEDHTRSHILYVGESIDFSLEGAYYGVIRL